MDEILRVEDRFYILATASRAGESSRVLKHGDTFALFDPRGDIVTEGLREHGLYHQGTRFLAGLRLRVDQLAPLLLSSRVRESNDQFGADLTNPDIVQGGMLTVPRDLLHFYRCRFLLDGCMYESLRISNYGMTVVAVDVTIAFAADFADIFEIRGMARPRRGTMAAPVVAEAGIVLGYDGLDRVTRRTHIRFEPRPDRLTASSASFSVRLAPQQTTRVIVTVGCQTGTHAVQARPFDEAIHAVEHEIAGRARVLSRITTSHEQFNAWLRRSATDLRMMISATPEGPYPYAGVPWFNTVFGRDGIITALSTLTAEPAIAHGVLAYLAATQADGSDPERDAEPGKILHEMRLGEMAALREVPFGRYYGTVDATPLFVALAGAYYTRTRDAGFIDAIWPNILRALEWIDHYGDHDGDGFVEYARRTPSGLVQQGWKDSHDSVFHADGRLADPPIALCEVQGYVYDAKVQASRLARARGDRALADRLEQEAERLRRRFEEAFWCEAIGTYALALDGDKQPCRVRTSNAGHCLFSGIVAPDRARRVAQTLLEPESFSGWGIRTLAAGQRRYNPMSYHNGSIWPHDNALIAAGFARYGLTDAVVTLVSAMFDASRAFELHRMPELFCGFHRRDGDGPTAYPVACAPQAWASATAFLLVDALLQVRVDPEAHQQVTVGAGALPQFLDWIALEHLDVAGERCDVRVERTRDGVQVSRVVMAS